MVDVRVESNRRLGLWIGPASAIADINKPTLAELNSLTNVSEAAKWDGFDFGLEASDQDEDRALTDAAGAASRGIDQYGGPIAFYTPQPTDVSSVYRDARSLVSTPHTELVIVVRTVLPASTPWAAGQVFNAYKVITDANRHQRGDKNRYYTIDFKPKGGVGVNRIVPSASPNPVVITPGTLTVAAGETLQMNATYEGNNITVGATYTVDDESVAIVTKHGIIIAVGAGTTSFTASYPGSAAYTPEDITVTA